MNIVTGFVGGINQRGDRDLAKYISFGLELMAVETPMTVFIERAVFDVYVAPKLSVPLKRSGSFLYKICGGVLDGVQRTYYYVIYGHVQFVFFEKPDLFLWPYKPLAHAFSLNTGNPNKDTLEYMMVQCQKSEWLAISLAFSQHMSDTSTTSTTFQNDDFRPTAFFAKEHVWIDFGAFHMFKGKSDQFQIELHKMRNRVNRRLLQYGESTKVLFASCWDPNNSYGGDIYKDINWSFAGSVFGGGGEALCKFAHLTREKCFQILRERNTIMWEINVWLLVYRDHPELFSFYPSDHSEIIFLHYI